MPKTKLQVPFPEPKNLVEYGTIEGTTEERCQGGESQKDDLANENERKQC